MNVLPSLSFTEAIKTATSRMNDFRGRSRRSEFWWWMLIVFLLKQVVGHFVTDYATAVCADALCMLAGLAVTVRRLHDGNHSGAWVYTSYACGFISLMLMVKSGYIDFVMKMAQKGAISDSKLNHFVESLPTWGVQLFAVSSFVWMLTSLVVIVFCLTDSKPAANKYGESIKYINYYE